MSSKQFYTVKTVYVCKQSKETDDKLHKIKTGCYFTFHTAPDCMIILV